MAGGNGRPVVLTAFGSAEKIFALVPLAILSAASVAGLATTGDGDPTATPSPNGSGTAAGTVGHQTDPSQVPQEATPTAARPAISKTTSPAVEDDDTSREAVDQQQQPETVDEPTSPQPRDEPPAQQPTGSPDSPQPPTQDPSPTTPPETEDNVLTRAEATLQCLNSGISQLDVLALTRCVEDLLNG